MFSLIVQLYLSVRHSVEIGIPLLTKRQKWFNAQWQTRINTSKSLNEAKFLTRADLSSSRHQSEETQP